MFSILFCILLIAHGLIHIMGFVKGFGYARINQITKEISRPIGVLWLLAMITLITVALLYTFKISYWWNIALAAVVMSQLLIVLYWRDAKFGTIANTIILIVAGMAGAEWRFENQYKNDVEENLTQQFSDSLLTIESIAHLPQPVQRYITYSGFVDKPIPRNFKIEFAGQIRQDEKSAWMPFTCEQYNFTDKPTRLFFMKAKMKGFPVAGYHAFKNGVATMNIRLLSLFPVQYQEGDKMNVSETVTWFNDLCLYAPGALADKRIEWEPIDKYSAKATFRLQDIRISAKLYFNEKGELINFISEDRYRIASKEDAQSLLFSTPVKNYMKKNDHIIPAYGEAIWTLPGGDLTYGQFNCEDIRYNVKQ